MASAFRRGVDSFDAGRFSEAVALLSDYVGGHQADLRARLWLARATAEAGEVDAALGVLGEAGAAMSRSAIPHAFAALIQLDEQRFVEAVTMADSALRIGASRLAEAVRMLGEVWQGNLPPARMEHLIGSTGPDVAGRALLLCEVRGVALPAVVLRDVMDEVGIGWPKYRFPPSWLVRREPDRQIWRLMARGDTREAFLRVSAWDGTPVGVRRVPTMIAAAMVAGEWEAALRWANGIPQYRAFAEGVPPRRSLNHFQVALFRGFCTLMRGDSDGSLSDLSNAANLDSTSYLPRYLRGRAATSRTRPDEARREFVAASQRLNPSLAVVQWRALRRA